jgi:hypothetical protein
VAEENPRANVAFMQAFNKKLKGGARRHPAIDAFCERTQRESIRPMKRPIATINPVNR